MKYRILHVLSSPNIYKYYFAKLQTRCLKWYSLCFKATSYLIKSLSDSYWVLFLSYLQHPWKKPHISGKSQYESIELTSAVCFIFNT